MMYFSMTSRVLGSFSKVRSLPPLVPPPTLVVPPGLVVPPVLPLVVPPTVPLFTELEPFFTMMVWGVLLRT